MNINWDNLGFEFIPVNSHIRYTFENGNWDDGMLLHKHNISLPIAATCLHYGQSIFEGLKAFACQDGKVRIFRPDANSARFNNGIKRVLGPEVPKEMFIDAVKRVINDNLDYVPPYGTGGALYVRPLIIGSGAKIGVSPSDTYEFLILVTPVGPYYKGGIKPMDALILEDFDRAAPNGTGNIKMSGNYAASLLPGRMAKDRGFQVALFLDAAKHEYIEEFGTSNFIGITADGTYVTPDSDSVLGSITNNSLQKIARDFDIPVEVRPVHKNELADFVEVGACGTAVVITPIGNLVYGDKTYHYGDECGPVLRKLYDQVKAIQVGEQPDEHNWLVEA